MKIQHLLEQEMSQAEEKAYIELGDKLLARVAKDPKLLDNTEIKNQVEKYKKWKDKKAAQSGGVTPPSITPVQSDSEFTREAQAAAINFNKKLSSEAILKIQQSIKANLKIDLPVVDGVNNELFVKLVYAAQKQLGIKPTGKWDRPTLAAFNQKRGTVTPNQNPNQPNTDKPSNQPDATVNITTPEQFAALPGKMFTHSGDTSQYKILGTKPYANDPNVTVVMFAQLWNGSVEFYIVGIDSKIRREFVLDQDVSAMKRDKDKVKSAFDNKMLKLKGPYLYYDNTLTATVAKQLPPENQPPSKEHPL